MKEKQMLLEKARVYAAKYFADHAGFNPDKITDEDLKKAFCNCVIPAKPHLYPLIKNEIKNYIKGTAVLTINRALKQLKAWGVQVEIHRHRRSKSTYTIHDNRCNVWSLHNQVEIVVAVEKILNGKAKLYDFNYGALPVSERN